MINRGDLIDNRYKIIKSIGEGGMANVYLAYDTILEREVAVKILIDIIKRGFINYKDFKDQLNAIDLAYVEDNDELMELFNLLRKDN